MLEGFFLDITIEGLKQSQQKFAKRLEKYKGKQHISVIVGYSAPHAVFVHEIGPPRRHYQKGKSHKFLERPARTERKTMIDIITEVLDRKDASMKRALTKAGNHLLRVSKEIVPVDTGELKNSGFVHVYDW